MMICVSRLIAKPPQSKRDASILFAYFASRLGEIGQNNVVRLSEAPIVPVVSQTKTENGFVDEKATARPDLRHLTPQQCYLGSSATYGDIFEFVDFGNEANAFLMKCGSKSEPTRLELASLACREPARLLGIMQSPEKYLGMLRSLADDLPTLKKDKVLFKQMKTAKFLLGAVEIPSEKNSKKSFKLGSALDGNGSDDEFEENSIREYQLASASQTVINDSYTSYQLFKGSLICAPEEEKLEDFYIALGAPTMSSIVQEDLRIGNPSEKQAAAVKIRSHILERAKLFLHESPRDNIKHDARWLDKNLALQAVSSISLRRSLRGHTLSHTEKRSAALNNERGRGWILYITEGGYDTYQISLAISRLLLERPSQQAVITLETFLNLNLLQLRSRGYNVDRILRAKQAEQRIAEEERKKQLAAEQEELREQEQQWKQANPTVPVPVAAREKQPEMPGTFDSGSSENSPEPAPRSRSRGLFSGLKSKFGLDGRSEAQEQIQQFLGGGSSQPQPPRYPQQTPPLPPAQGQDPNGPPTYDELTKPQGAETVSSPQAVQQNLLSAINSSRAHDSSTLFSPPTTKEVKEQATYCDTTHAQNITFLADASNGMRIFVSKTLPNVSSFLSSNSTALNNFAALLIEVASVYALSSKAMHVYYDEQGSTIAFNSNGSIFCNFRFFAQLHMRSDGSGGKTKGQARQEAAAYWWIVVAHELAHNLVKEHDSRHSFYTLVFPFPFLASFFLELCVVEISSLRED